MGFGGVLEDKHLPHVPGTVILNEEFAHSSDVTAGLRHGSGKDAHIILVPQPSEDPNDPLNWPITKKRIILAILGFGTSLIAATISPLLNAGLFTISLEFGVEIGDITLISGYQLLIAGASAPFIGALARKYGKRPCFLFSSVMALIGTIIGSCTNSYDGLLAARIVQGFGIAAYESLIVSVIGDLFFVHERGFYTSIIMFLLAGVSNFSSVITGYITANLGWKYLFHLLNAFIGLQIILLFFFCPETAYLHDRRYETDELATDDLRGLSEVEKRHEARMERKKLGEGAELAQMETVANTVRSVPKKKTFMQETAVFTGSYSDENLLQLVIGPLAVFSNIAVFWVVIISGTITATYVAQAYILAQVFSFPPYNLDASGVGLLSLGPFIGGILGSIVLGMILDPTIKWLCAKNKGVYEPEYRLVIMIGALVTGAALMAWGYMIENGIDMYACATVHGLVLFGVIAATLASSAYALDAYRDMSNEVFLAGMLVKNFLFYAWSYFVNDWTASSGPAEVFYVFGGVAFALVLSTIPVYIFGKKYVYDLINHDVPPFCDFSLTLSIIRYRSYWFRHNLLTKFSIRTHAEY
ncbi:hypothetical protein IFR04_012919 [Cadophora malorum]|uniref:Major facilitator superfamily (MFS) profile domain-containing protein n=1 Tax=Cadophora malorum TaxID=108018 RepID=A0A8H7W3M5_9HELO|nr:hypothetical protein IFR04_012919 [Cadophora malorum]